MYIYRCVCITKNGMQMFLSDAWLMYGKDAYNYNDGTTLRLDSI